MRKITQIPDNVLNEIETRELIQLIIDYPLLCDMFAFNSLEEGYEHIKEEFNGIDELLSRDDAYDELLKVYDEYVIPLEKNINYDIIMASEEAMEILDDLCKNRAARNKIYEDAKVKETINILEFMIFDIVTNNELEADEFINVYIKKSSQKKNSNHYTNNSALALYSVVADDEENIFSSYAERSSNSSYTNIYVTTPSGNIATARYYATLELCDTASWVALVAEYNASIVSTASVTFNCHSFAWLKDLRSDYQHILLTSVTPFLTDSYYEESTVAQVGDIAYWGPHSAIITQINIDDPNDTINWPESYCISKWATGPMVAHFLKRCPYYNSTHHTAIRYYRPQD